MKTAIALIGYDRPGYFGRVLASIAANPEAQAWPLFVFLDGPADVEQKVQARMVKASKIAESYIIQYSGNVGCGLNIIMARQYLFDKLEFDRVFVMEDDLVISPHYFGVVSRLMDWCEANYSDIGVVQGYWHCREDVAWKREHLADVATGNPHWWGYMMTRTAWDAIKPDMMEYTGMFLQNRPYWQRDEWGIREWARSKLDAWDGTYQGDRQFPYHWREQYSYWLRTEHPLPASGQDGMTALSLQVAGLKKVCTVVNRGVNIGAQGMHTNAASWQRNKMDVIELDIFDSDETLSEFEAVEA